VARRSGPVPTPRPLPGSVDEVLALLAAGFLVAHVGHQFAHVLHRRLAVQMHIQVVGQLSDPPGQRIEFPRTLLQVLAAARKTLLEFLHFAGAGSEVADLLRRQSLGNSGRV
jgi:hypothetical protein